MWPPSLILDSLYPCYYTYKWLSWKEPWYSQSNQLKWTESELNSIKLNLTQSIFWFDLVMQPNKIEFKQKFDSWTRSNTNYWTDFTVGSLSPVELDWFRNHTHKNWCSILFRSIAELNQFQSTDWVWLSSISGCLIGLLTVFSAILTGRQSSQKLQCLYGNPMANNIFQNWFLHNLWIVTLKY